jgi:hypothetical protein
MTVEQLDRNIRQCLGPNAWLLVSGNGSRPACFHASRLYHDDVTRVSMQCDEAEVAEMNAIS